VTVNDEDLGFANRLGFRGLEQLGHLFRLGLGLARIPKVTGGWPNSPGLGVKISSASQREHADRRVRGHGLLTHSWQERGERFSDYEGPNVSDPIGERPLQKLV
jgi:hypothetical protein